MFETKKKTMQYVNLEKEIFKFKKKSICMDASHRFIM